VLPVQQERAILSGASRFLRDAQTSSFEIKKDVTFLDSHCPAQPGLRRGA
jgi:hypothetical protein